MELRQYFGTWWDSDSFCWGPVKGRLKEDLRVTHGAVFNALMTLKQPENQTATKFTTKFGTLLRDCDIDDNSAKSLFY